MPKIRFTGDIFRKQKYGGVSKYFSRLISGLRENPEFSIFVDVFVHINRHLDKNTLNQPNLVSPFSLDTPLISRLSREVDNLFLRNNRKENFDILHETFFYAGVVQNNSEQRVVTIYDTIREIFGPHTGQLEKKAKSIDLSDHIICISETTKGDLIKFYGTPSQKISVIPLGVDKAPFVNKSFKITKSKEKHQLLFLGQRDGYKNFSFLLETFQSSSELQEHFNLVVVGPRYSERELMEIQDRGLEQHITYRGSEEHSLQKEFRSSSALLVPSLYEGFGLAALEAMMSGCVVFSSGTGAQREVLRDSSIYFDPLNPDSLSSRLLETFGSPGKMVEMAYRGRLLAEEFSWNKTVSATCDVYNKLIQGGNY